MHTSINEDKLTYSVTQAGELLGIGRSAAYQGVRKGEIPSVTIGNRILVPKTALKRLLSEAGASSNEDAV